MDQYNKSKSVTTSVPSISIKFHANAEQIEEVYSEDETNAGHEKGEIPQKAPSSPLNIVSGDPDNSPLKLFPKLVKRSTSIDVGNAQLDASPPSDPWRFFSDIKGKITKSVEEKITEIKTRNQEEGSPQHRAKQDSKAVKDGKDSASVSDSEDLSESSISKTWGLASTTEGAEMSSDDDTPSLDQEKEVPGSLRGGLRHRFRFLRHKTKPAAEEGEVKETDLSKLYNILAERTDRVLREDSDEVENAIDALEEVGLDVETEVRSSRSGSDVLKCVAGRIDNIELDCDNTVSIKEVHGSELREEFFDCNKVTSRTVFAPKGFVDLRPTPTRSRPLCNHLRLTTIFLSAILYVIIQYYSPYLAGMAVGLILSFVLFQAYLKIYPAALTSPLKAAETPSVSNKILEVQAVTEYQPLQKYEGWANEYPDAYSPETYHISQTQSVFMRLQGNLLRISHSKNKVPKRAMWNEPEIYPVFTHHRIYNLLGAKISLLPNGLARKRLWSKKYPICITLAKDQMCFDSEVLSKLESEDEKHGEKEKTADKGKVSARERRSFSRFRKRDYTAMAQRFSKLTEDDCFDLDSDSRASTPSADTSDAADSSVQGDEDILCNDANGEDVNVLPSEWATESNSPDDLRIYIFGRTDREKEDWVRRLSVATHKGIGVVSAGSCETDPKDALSDMTTEATNTDLEYLKYMSMFKASKRALPKPSDEKETAERESPEALPESRDEDPLLWLNAAIGRVLFDCVRDPHFIEKVKDRIQRKLSTIKLPYFIEELLIPELSLGKTTPWIHKASKPTTDDRGLWIDLDVAYQGLIVLTLQTKLNLMRLKNPQAYEKTSQGIKSAIYHSDVDDSAESSSDEDGPQEIPHLLQDVAASPAGSGNSGKKFIKMVDRLTESKFFQAATDNRYIKKAMEGVSNTDLRLTVEVRSIIGALVLNIPPPPSDRIWIGFRPTPEIALSARPIVGERHLSYIMVTSWIEKKLLLEFQKVMVIPNMEDFVIPVMNPKLPE